MTTLAPPPSPSVAAPSEIAAVRLRLLDHFATGATRPVAERRRLLRALYSAVKKHEPALHAALYADLRKSAHEAFTTETGLVRDEISHALHHLDTWAAPQPVSAPLALQPAWGRVRREPLGAVLIIAPWNYPVQLALTPLAAALAAGNVALLKPSELAPHTSAALRALIADTFAPHEVAVVEGGVEAATELLRHPWGHIFFTGSTQVGQVVYRAAAETMSPVTLELGGKSPAIVAADAPLALTARRLVWGKFTNAGQTCVAPDYLLVDERIAAPLVAALSAEITAQFGADPQQSADYGRIISERHFNRLLGYLDGGHIAHGGQNAADTRYLAPTLLTEPQLDHAVMRDEIFGPVLPILPYRSLDVALAFTNARPKPLASYVFTSSGRTAQSVVEGLDAGGTVINDTLIHLGNSELPFGGVGLSGIGQYHGRFGFDTFSRPRAVLKKPFWLDQFVRYAPVRAWQTRVARWFIG